MAAKTLADAENDFKTFRTKHQAEGRQIFAKTVSFFVDAFKFDSQKVTAALDEEIDAMKRKIEETK